MSNLQKYLQLDLEEQLLVEVCLLIYERTSTLELSAIAQSSKENYLIKALTAINSTVINNCAKERFLVFRYAAIEPLDFNKEEIFFKAIQKPYFKSLCIGFYKYAKERRNYYSWSWSDHFSTLGLLMKLYVFEDTEIEENPVLMDALGRVQLDERWYFLDKILNRIYLQGLDFEKFMRIPFPKVRMLLLEDAFNFKYSLMQIPKPYISYMLDRQHQIRNNRTFQQLINTLLFQDEREFLDLAKQNAPNFYQEALVNGTMAFMDKKFDEALKYFDQSVQQLKKLENQKRVPFSTAYAMLGLCLLATKADAKTWDNYWKTLYKDGIYNSFLSLGLAIVSGSANVENHKEWNNATDEYINTNSSLFNLPFLAYIVYWSGRRSLAWKILKNNKFTDTWKNNAWIAKEMQTLIGILEEDDDKISNSAVLKEVFAPKPEWEMFLTQLDKIFNDAGNDNNAKAERVIWRIDINKMNLEAVVQKHNAKSGSWSKGRTIAWNKIDDGELLDISTDQDKLIANRYLKMLKSDSYRFSGDRNAEFLADILDAMVAHPNLYVMNSSDTPMQIHRGKMELRLVKTNKGYQFENPYKDSTVENVYVLKRETPTRYSFILLSKEQQQMLDLLNKRNVVLPNKAEDQLRETIKKMVSVVPIHSDLEVEDSNIPEHPIDKRVYVHILPVGESFQVELFVKPFGIVPPYFSPGSGHERILADVEGITKFVQRNLKEEQKASEEIIASSTILDFNNHQNGIWTLDSIEDCLMLLSELNELRKSDKIVLEWPQGERLRISAYASFDNLFMKVRSSGDWFELEGELKIAEDYVMDMQMLLERSRQSQSRFLTLDDGSYLALTEQLYRRLKEMEGLTLEKKDKIFFSQFAGAAMNDMVSDLQIEGDKGWTEFIKRMDEARDKRFLVPKELQAELRPYQKEGFLWLCRMAWWGAGACLADDMGLGKTVQAIALLLRRSGDGPALVVAPASVCANWISELNRFAPSLTAINLSQVADRNKTIENIKAKEVLVTTYGLLHQSSETLCEKKFATIVLDEAQSIKNRFTKRSQAAMDLQGDFKLITTGTPMENHLGELWNLFHFINPGLLGSAQQFQERFALPIEKYGDKWRREQLQKLIRPFILRRLKKEVLQDLPEKTEITLSIERSPAEEAFYEALRRKALETIQSQAFENEGQKQLQVLAELMRLRRACCHPKLIAGGEKIPSAKLEALSDLIDELLENKHKALIFSQFVDYLRIIEAMVKEKNISYQYLDGSTPLKKRKESVDAFQAGEGDLFLISLKAGGTGLNLTAADYVIHVDPWWNPAVEDQASDRAHRIGQQQPVTVYRLVASNSIEEKIVRLHSLKREMAEALLQNTDGKVRMNSNDLLELLKEEF